MSDLTEMFPEQWVKPGEDFGGSWSERTIWTGFAEAHDESEPTYHNHIIDYYQQSVHPRLAHYFRKHPHVWYEFQDAGTVFLIIEEDYHGSSPLAMVVDA